MQNHRLRAAGWFRRRTLALLVFPAFAAAQLLSGAAGAAPALETQATNLRTPVVNQQLIDQLQANPTGGVTAIVTTWNRDGLDDVAALGVAGTRLKVLPMLIAPSLTRAQLDLLSASPAVRSVWPEERYEILMEDSTWVTKARYVWSATTPPGGLKGYGITGAGIELGLIDTGFDGLHEDGDNLIEYCDATSPAAGTSSRMDVNCTPWVSTYNNAPAGACGASSPGPELTGPGGTCQNKARGDSLDQDVSHGSHVGGTMVGTGDASGGRAASHSTIGMAPDAKLRVWSANVGPSLLNTQSLAAYDDMTYKKEHGYNKVIAVNNSWGGTGGATYNPNDPTAIAVKRAYDAGIVSVFAAGNSGPEHNTLSPQCIIPWVVCVAASTKPDSVVAFSSKGRPSEPSDTNRDGVIDGNDVPPDNHDRTLGQKLGIGLYRPTLTAPGVSINSIKAIAANIGGPDAVTCRENDYILYPGAPSNCYVQAMGTSMATPHVTGAIGLIAQAFQQKRGRLPKPAEVIDILERSANTAKLPGWDTEEQGAGRLDVHQAVRYAKGDISLDRSNFGYPTPPYVAGSYGSSTTLNGCAQAGSWSARGTAAAPFYGQHFITVPPSTERIRLTVEWPNHTGANLYALLWRPGVEPDASGATPDASGRSNAYHQSRAWPDQEGTGIPTGAPPTYRLVEVRAPEETDTGMSLTIPSGKWILRVYDRTPGANATGCGMTQETPQVAGRAPGVGYEYNVKVELPQVTSRPSVKITSALTAIQTSRIVAVDGRASYPPEASDPLATKYGYSWEGITNWAVPGSAQAVGEEPENDTRTVLYLHGNTEEGCTGNGEADLVACDGPFLLPKTQLSAGTAAFWRTGADDEPLEGSSDRTIYDTSWSWCLAAGEGCPTTPETGIPAGPQTVGGPMTVEWWGQCNLCGGIFSADWNIRVWADGVLKFEQRVGASPPVLGEPGRMSATVALPTFTASQRIVVHIDPVYVDAQTVTFIYYDSETPCNALAPAGTRCDSLVRMPVGGGDNGSAPTPPQNIRVTDLPSDPPSSHPYPASKTFKGLRVAWDPQSPAPVRYELYRSTDPVFPNGGTKIKGTFVECVSPQAPTPGQPAGHDRQGLCYTDTHVNYGTVYYYRVVSVTKNAQGKDVRSSGSEIAYGMPTKFDRQVKLKVDTLYGPQVWENALAGQSPTPSDTESNGTTWTFAWDTQELLNGTYAGFPGPAFTLVPGPHLLSVRTFTQGIGSTKDGKPVTLDAQG